MPFGMIHRCFFSYLRLPRRRINRVLCTQAYVPNDKVYLTEKHNNVDINLNLRMGCRTELVGIICNDPCIPGQYTRLFCPKAFADSNDIRKVMSSREMTEKSLGLEPLGDKVIAYFAERMISEGTLRRNSVMQLSGDQDVIALPFKQNGVLVGCKYRTCREKKFWQVKGTQKWLFGLDDIKDADEIIIVEGEIDKLAMEEAGFLNCVSVPCGAPQKVSAKELPPQEKDTGYQYVWNCKEHLDKVSRIILATDGDTPGQALAEELARRLGKERCWRVQWPKKDEFCCFKDANEVLMFLGRDALKEVIENAELYQPQVPEQAMQCT